MAYKLHHSLADNYVHVRVSGTWPKQAPETIVAEIYAYWEQGHRQNLLIDIRKLLVDPTIAGDFEGVKRFMTAGYSRITRIAVNDIPARKRTNDFFEITAENRGMTFRFFYEDEQAAIYEARRQRLQFRSVLGELRFCLAVPDDLEAGDEAEAADVADRRMLGAEALQPLQ